MRRSRMHGKTGSEEKQEAWENRKWGEAGCMGKQEVRRSRKQGKIGKSQALPQKFPKPPKTVPSAQSQESNNMNCVGISYWNPVRKSDTSQSQHPRQKAGPGYEVLGVIDRKLLSCPSATSEARTYSFQVSISSDTRSSWGDQAYKTVSELRELESALSHLGSFRAVGLDQKKATCE